MSADGSASGSAVWWQRLLRLPSSYPRAAAALAYGIVAAAAGVAAFFTIFTIFAPYDDEGTLLTMLDAFVRGDALYADVYTPYGPFYYEFFGGLAALTGIEVTNEASRLTVIAVWLATSVFYGLVVQRISGRLLLGLIATIVAFAVLNALGAEPMHPHGLASLLLAGLLLAAALTPPRRLMLSGALAGSLLAALLLTKINLGLFAIAAVVLAAALAYGPVNRRPWLLWPVIAGFLAMPLVVMGRDLDAAEIRDHAALQVLAAAAVILVASLVRPPRGEDDRALGDWLLVVATWLFAAAALILAALMLTGPSPAAIYDGIVEEAMRIRDAALSPLDVPLGALTWGAAAILGAGLVFGFRRRGAAGAAPSVWPGLLRLAAGLVIWLAISRAAPFADSEYTLRIGLALGLAWVAAIPPAGVPEPPFKRFLRVLLPAVAVAETLQVYPVPGSQTGIAAVVFVPVGGLCIADGLASLRRWAAERDGVDAARRFGLLVPLLLVALLGNFAYQSLYEPARDGAELYDEMPSLSQPGAELIHVDPVTVATYEGVIELLDRHDCTAFVGYPSINSLYLWSGLRAPRPQVPGPWMRLLDDANQQRIVDQLRASPRPCVVRNEGVASAWLGGKPPPDTPLVRYIAAEFEPAFEIGQFEFLLPRGSA